MIKNIVANFIGRFWSILSNFLFIPLYISLLGFESYSIISFTLVIAGIMAVLDAGLTATLSREFARSDLSLLEKQNTFGTLETLYLMVTGLTIILVFVFSGVIASGWVTSTVYPSEEISLFVKIFSIDIGFQLLNRFYLGGFLGLEKQVKANIFQVAWGMVRNGVVLIALLFVPTLRAFFIWQASTTFVFAILTGIMLRKEITGLYFTGMLKIEKTVLQSNWKFAGGMLLISLVAALNSQMDKIAISKLLPLESLGFYTLAVSLSMGIVILVNPVSVAMLPRLTSLFSGGHIAKAQTLFDKANKLVSIVVFSIMANMCFFSYELIWIWTGNSEIAKQVTGFVPVIAIATTMLSLATIPYNIAIANGYTKLNNVMGILSLILTLPGYWIATRWYGAIGAAYVYCFVQTTITLVYIFLVNRRFFNEQNVIHLFFKPIVLPMMLALAVGFVFSFLPDFIANKRIYTFGWIGASTILTFATVLLVLIPKTDLIQFGKQLKLIKK